MGNIQTDDGGEYALSYVVNPYAQYQIDKKRCQIDQAFKSNHHATNGANFEEEKTKIVLRENQKQIEMTFDDLTI